MDTIETTIYTAVLITGIVIGLLIIYFAITIFRNHRKYFKTLRKQFLAEMELLEKERNRIARDLHDELGPLLTSARIHIEATTVESSEDRQHLEKASQKITILTERFGGIARNLTPRALVSRGLQTAIEDFVEESREITNMQMNLIYEIRSRIYTNNALHLFRMIQEMIHNAIKHSGASELTIHLKERKQRIFLYYKDNGKGLQQTSNEDSQGLGLESLQNRAKMLGGKMIYITQQGPGTEYFFQIPILITNDTEHTNSDS